MIESWDEDPAEYVKTELSVSERAYGAWPAPIRKLFEPARCAKPGKVKIIIEPARREAA